MKSISPGKRFIFGMMVSLLILSTSSGVLSQDQGKRVVIVVPLKGFWDIELTTIKEIFEQNGLMVTIASSTLKEAKGIFGTQIKPDVVLSKVRGSLYDAIIFVGGEGAVQYWDDPQAHRLVKTAFKEGKILGAISIAPITLANTKVLKGRRATVWSTLGKRLKRSGAIYTGNPLEVDGNIVTADSYEVAEEFAKTILGMVLQK
jgi:protease I